MGGKKGGKGGGWKWKKDPRLFGGQSKDRLGDRHPQETHSICWWRSGEQQGGRRTNNLQIKSSRLIKDRDPDPADQSLTIQTHEVRAHLLIPANTTSIRSICGFNTLTVSSSTFLFLSLFKSGPEESEGSISSAERHTSAPPAAAPAAAPSAPSNQLNGLRFTDVIKQTNYHKLVIYHTHEDQRPRPPSSASLTESVWILAITHCLLCVFADEPRLYVPHTLRRSDSRSFVGASGQGNKSPVFSSVGGREGPWKCYQTRMVTETKQASRMKQTHLCGHDGAPLIEAAKCSGQGLQVASLRHSC